MVGRRERNADRGEYERGLDGLEYPASLDAIVRTARDKGGLDGEVIHVLERLPARTYESEAEVLAEVEQAYAAGLGLEGAGPAAPAEREVKDTATRKADPRRGEPT
jgi:hypothetical protein